MTLTLQRMVRFDRRQYARLEKIANEQNRSIADVLRMVVDHYLEGQGALTASQKRQARVSEYAQIALDTIILEQRPEYRERIIAETDRRMERYHGA